LPRRGAHASAQVLEGYKAIVAHIEARFGLVYSVDTMRRWVITRGLPVMRDQHHVCITEDALEKWFDSSVRKPREKE
jgi:hypothetical protein